MDTRNGDLPAFDARIPSAGRVAPPVPTKSVPVAGRLDVLMNLDAHRDHAFARASVELLARELEEPFEDTWATWHSDHVIGRHAVVVAGPGQATVVGAAYAMVADAHHADAVGRISYSALSERELEDRRVATNLNAFARASRVGVLCAIAVHPAHRHNGHARRLIDARRDLLTDLGCDVIYADAWQRPEPCDSVTLYSRLGWHALAEVPSFWERLHAHLDEPCPEPSLDCDGVVYVYDDIAAQGGQTNPGNAGRSLGR